MHHVVWWLDTNILEGHAASTFIHLHQHSTTQKMINYIFRVLRRIFGPKRQKVARGWTG